MTTASTCYVSGTKVFLASSLLVNVTLRHSKANQLGLFGFGGDEDGDASLNFETTVGYLLDAQARDRRRVSRQARQPGRRQ